MGVVVPGRIQSSASRIGTVIGDAFMRAFGIGAVGHVQPAIAARQVGRDAETQTLFERGIAPHLNEVFPRPLFHGVPFAVPGVPQVEVVVVGGARAGVSGSGPFEQGDQFVRVEVLRLPHRDEIFVTEFGGMAVVLQVVFIFLTTLEIQFAGVPFAHLRNRVRSPVQIDAELGVAEPLRAAIISKRLDGELEREGAFDTVPRHSPICCCQGLGDRCHKCQQPKNPGCPHGILLHFPVPVLLQAQGRADSVDLTRMLACS